MCTVTSSLKCWRKAMRRHHLCITLLVCATALHAQTRPRATPIVSPDVQADGHVTFRLRAPQAKEVTLRGEWVAAGGIDVSPPVEMTRDDQGVWSVTVGPLPSEVLAYSFTV